METQHSSELLIKEILEQSASEAKTILEQAQIEVDRQINKTKKEAEAEQEQIIKNAQLQAEAIRKKILSHVKLEVKKQQLENREKTIKRIFQDLTDRLNNYRQHPDYRSFLNDSIVEAVAALQGNHIHLQVGKGEKKLLDPKGLKTIEKQALERAKRKVTLKVVDDLIHEGGVLAVSSDGRMRFDNRFSAQLRRIEDKLRLMIVKEIFKS